MLLTLIPTEHMRMFHASKPIGILHLTSFFKFARVPYAPEKDTWHNEWTAVQTPVIC